MIITLDAKTEQHIQREIDLGHYDTPSEVIAAAVSLLAAQTDWLRRNKEALNEHLDESMAQVERREVIPGEQVRSGIRELIASHRASKTTTTAP